jgi:uncharacterized protein (DUF58 family)
LFTTKATAYFSAALSLFILALVLNDFQIGVLVLGLAALFFLSNTWGLPEKIELRLDRKVVPNETFGDEDIRVESCITNLTGTQLANIEVYEQHDPRIILSKGSDRTMASLGASQEMALTGEFTSPPRAIYRIGPLVAEVRDPLGFYLKVQKLPPESLSVMPRPENLGGVQLRPRHVGPWPGVVPSRILGNGTEFYSLREYVTGDDPKRINWKASAHYNMLIINEAEAEKVTDIMVVLDTDVTFFGQTGAELFEREVQAAASIVRALLRQGNRVGLVLQGGERGSIPAGFGKRHERRILYLLAAAKPGRATVSTNYVMNLLARRMLPPRAQIVVISPLLDPEMKEGISELTAAGYGMLILSPSPTKPSSFNSQTEEIAFKMIMLERSITLLSLERTASVVDWPNGIPLITMITKARRTRRVITA